MEKINTEHEMKMDCVWEWERKNFGKILLNKSTGFFFVGFDMEYEEQVAQEYELREEKKLKNEENLINANKQR